MSVQIRTTSRGERRYDVRLRRGDGSVYTKSFRTKKAAESFERAELSARDRGTWTDPRAGAITVDEYVRGWLQARTVRGRPLSPRTNETYRYLLDRFVLPAFGALQLNAVRANDVRDWHGQMSRNAPTSVAPKAYRLLHAIFATALNDGLIAANPCRVTSAGGERPAERPVLSPDDIAALAGAIEPRWRAMILVAAYGALRFGELIGLRRRDIDLLHGVVIVDSQLIEVANRHVRTAPKSAAGRRRVNLPAFVVAELGHHLDTYVSADPETPVFSGERGGTPTRTNWSRTWARARHHAGVRPDIHLHDLRHAGATLAAQAGATTKELMARLGHASPRAALIYQHAADHRDQAIAESLDRLAGRAHQGAPSEERAMDARWTPPESQKGDPRGRPHTA